MAAVTTVPPGSALRSAREEGLMLRFQGDPGKGPQPSAGIYLVGFRLSCAKGSPGGGATASSSICIHVNKQST